MKSQNKKKLEQLNSFYREGWYRFLFQPPFWGLVEENVMLGNGKHAPVPFFKGVVGFLTYID